MSFKTTIYGKYFLLDRIAVGGMAEVFKAKTFGVHGFERLLVIKRILPHLSKDAEFVDMFIDEAKISVELNHANICQVTDLGKIGDNYFIAMEFIDGKDLRAILKKSFTIKKPLSIPTALLISMEMLKGLDYAHRKTDSLQGKPINLIHRDISPQNIMLSYSGQVKIVDFGIAKTESKLNRTQAGVLKGKFGYMSPEQASGLELDARTDLFSAGILLYEMLTGKRLFLGENDFETLEKIKECKIPSLKALVPSISDELDQAVHKALSKEKEDRFSSAQEMHGEMAKIFYAQYSDYHASNLSEFVRNLFAEEIVKEQEALKRAIDSLPQEDLKAAIRDAESHGSHRSRPVSPDATLPAAFVDRWKKYIKPASYVLGPFFLIYLLSKLFSSSPTPPPPAPEATSVPTVVSRETAQPDSRGKIKLESRRLTELIDEIHELKRQRADFEGKLSGILEGHRRLLELHHDQREEKQIENLSVLPATS